MGNCCRLEMRKTVDADNGTWTLDGLVSPLIGLWCGLNCDCGSGRVQLFLTANKILSASKNNLWGWEKKKANEAQRGEQINSPLPCTAAENNSRWGRKDPVRHG